MFKEFQKITINNRFISINVNYFLTSKIYDQKIGPFGHVDWNAIFNFIEIYMKEHKISKN